MCVVLKQWRASMSNPEKSQMYRELLCVDGMNFHGGTVSAGRKQMYGSHIGQALVTKGANERSCQTGMCREFGKYTYSIKVPGDPEKEDGIEIIKIIERYPNKVGLDSIALNPQTILIYEDSRTKIVGMIELKNFCTNHQYFGFNYVATDALHNIRVGSQLKAGTILLDSPSKKSNGAYAPGIELNVAYMTHPAVSEDSVAVCSDVLDRLSIDTFESRTVEWGKSKFALNLYGTTDIYKPFPDIGDFIRPDGLLMALRPYDKDLAVVEQSVNDLLIPDFIFDKLYYAGGAGGQVVDIRIQRNNLNISSDRLGEISGGMDAQIEKYDVATRKFYQSIVNEYKRLHKDRKEKLQLTPEFNRMVVEAMSVVSDDAPKVVKVYKRTPIDDYRIEFVIKHHIKPNLGFKITDTCGGKGVFSKIIPPEQMPVDSAGNRADVIMDPNSTIDRMNVGRLYEQFINAASRDVVVNIRNVLNIDNKRVHKQQLESINNELIDKVWNYLIGYYSITSPKIANWFRDGSYKGTKRDHLMSILNDKIYLYLPPEDSPELSVMVKDINKNYRPVYGPVTYVGNSGKRVTTVNNVRIGPVYMLMLEKIGDSWTAVSSGKLQHFGILSQVFNSDKYSQPNRVQAIRAMGEAEVRIFVSYVGPMITADIMDRSNNPITHNHILDNILESDKPTDIYMAVNRNECPLGGSKPLGLVRHIGICSGWRFVYKKHIPNYKPIY